MKNYVEESGGEIGWKEVEIAWGGGNIDTQGQTSRLLDGIGPVGRFGEKH